MQKGELFYDAKNFNWSYNTLTIKILIHTRCETHDLALAVTATANAGSRIEDPDRSHVRCSIHPTAQADAVMTHKKGAPI